MKNLQFHIEINPKLYLKDPNSSELGHRIIAKSIEMINEIGFESFTFKKLGAQIESNESSIYRYFENKHALLVYLTSWYWSWTEYRLVFAMMNIQSAEQRLKIAIDILTQPVLEDNDFTHINEILLSQIIFSESLKAFHTKNVDAENQKGCFKAYKSVVNRITDIILEIAPDYNYPRMLISTVIEGAHQQKYFAEHLPSLTDISKVNNTITSFYQDLVLELIK